jgi:hypothetical protein
MMFFCLFGLSAKIGGVCVGDQGDQMGLCNAKNFGADKIPQNMGYFCN